MSAEGRPTWAQISTVEQLLNLILLAGDAMTIAVDASDRSELHRIVAAAELLIPLIDGDESWITPALAFDAESAQFVRTVIGRRFA